MLSYCCNCSLAHSSKKQYGDAKVCFERALEMDPTNDSYKTNLEFANQKLEESVSFLKQNIISEFSWESHISCCVWQNQMPGGFPMMPGFPGMGNDPSAALGPFAQFLNNPAIMNMVSILQSPMTQISSHMFFQIIHYCFVRIASFRLLKWWQTHKCRKCTFQSIAHCIEFLQ